MRITEEKEEKPGEREAQRLRWLSCHSFKLVNKLFAIYLPEDHRWGRNVACGEVKEISLTVCSLTGLVSITLDNEAPFMLMLSVLY